MKLIPALLLSVALLLNSGCGTSSLYNQYQKAKPAAAQTKARAMGVLQIRAAGDNQEQQIMAGVDLAKLTPSFFEILSEEPMQTAKAAGWDALKVGAIAYAGKWINDKYGITSGGGSNNDNSGPAINASNGGNVEVNGAPSESYNSHSLNANGPNSKIQLNYDGSGPNSLNNSKYNADGSINTDGHY